MKHGSDTTYAIEGARNASLSRRVDTLEQAATAAGGTGVAAPVICGGGFYVSGAEERLKRGVRVTFCVDVPAGTKRLKTILIKASDADTAAHYGQRRFPDTYEITDDRTHLEYKFTPLLEYATQYRLIRLVGIGGDEGRVFFPLVEQLFNESVPAAMLFTTPAQFGAPGSPSLADLFTDLDPTTPEYDAYALLTQHAPTDPVTGANLSYRAAGVTDVQAVLERGYPTGTEQFPFEHHLTDEDLDRVDGSGRGLCKVKAEGLHPGGAYTWKQNTVFAFGELRKATGSIAFRAAHQDTNLGLLTNLAVVAISTGEFDSKQVQINLKFSQPSGLATDIVALKNYTLKMKRTTVADYDNLVDRGNLVQADAYHKLNLAAGTISISNGSPVINGVGTDFTKFQEGWEIKVGAQTLVLKSITSATVATATTPSVGAVSASAFTVVIVIPLKVVKVKPNKSYNLRVLLRGRADTVITIDGAFSTGADGEVVNDTNVPTGLVAPVIEWTTAGRLQIRNLNFGSLTTEQSQTATLQKKYLLIYEGGTYLDIVTRTAASGLAGALFEIGLKSHLTLDSIKKKIYKNVFGASGNFRAAWYASNNLLATLGFSAQSPDSNVLNVATMGNEVLADGSDGVGTLDSGAAMNSKTNIMPNGDFHYGTATVLQSWARRTTPFTSATNLDTTTANGIYWDQDDDWIVWIDNGNRAYGPLKKWIKGKEIITVTFMAKTLGVLVDPVVTLRVRLGDNTDITVTGAPCTLTGLTTTFQMYGGTLTIIDNPGSGGNRFLSCETAHTLTGVNAIVIDKVMVVRGKDPATFSPRPEYEKGNGGTDEDPDTTPTATPSAIVDTGQGVGPEGGFFDPGFGGRFQF